MPKKGFKIADAYVEITTDRSALNREVRDIPGQVGADADRAGRAIGDKITAGLAQEVQKLSAKIKDARRAEVEADNALRLAETRLNEARESGNQKASTMLALQQRLEKAQYALAQAHGAASTAINQHNDAERRLAAAMADLGRKAGPDAERSGRELGGKLSQGIHLSLVRNSPLIAAAIGAALVAGAPLLLAAATGIFAGIGIIAAAQSERVKSAWLGTWQRVKEGAIADAGVIEPVLVRMADRVGAGFERMRPLLRDAFTGAAPQIQVFTDGILALAENALPGMVRAVEQGMPVTKGLADFLGKVGTGLSDFFDKLSEHAPAAGEAFSAIGDILGELLPILGELLGQGAELATIVLPPVAKALGVVADVLDRLGPLLPIVAAGFMGLKVANGLTSMIGGLADRLAGVAANGGAFSGVAGRMAGGMGSMAAAAGPAAAGVGFVVTASMAWIDAGKKATDLAVALGRAMEVGGGQAAGAAAFVDKFAFANDFLNTKLGSAIGSIGIFGYTISDMVPDLEQGRAAYEKWYRGLDEGARAEEDVKVATDALREATERYGPASKQAADASKDLADKQAELDRINGELEMSTRGVTEAMLAQTEAIFSRADADLALRNAVDAQEDAFIRLNEAIRNHGAASEEADDAGRAWEGTLNSQIAAARRMATEALPAMMDANQKKALSDFAALDVLRQLEAQYGDKLPAAVRNQIAALEASTTGYDRAALEAGALTAATEEAAGSMDDLGKKKADPKITADASVFAGVHADAMAKIGQLDSQRPTPQAFLNSIPLMNGLGDAFARLGLLNGQRPTPQAFLNSIPLLGGVGNALGNLYNLGAQRPTPTGFLNTGPFAGGANWMGGTMGWLNSLRANPSAFLTAYTADAERALNYASRARTATVYLRQMGAQLAGGGPIHPIIKAAAGRVVGPGGPTDDLVPAIGPGGVDYHLSAGEWIVNAMVSRTQGDTKMALLNAGKAEIVPVPTRQAARGFAGGGIPIPQTSTSAGSSVVVQRLDVHLQGFDIRDRAEVRRFAQALRAELIGLDREQS